MRTTLCLSLCLAGTGLLSAQPSRVLVVYNSHPANVTESLDVAEHYRSSRGVPVANMCPVSFSDYDTLAYTDWTATVRPAIRACLDAAGRTNILYVVLSYRVPVKLVRSAPFGIATFASYISDIWDQYTTTLFPLVPPGSHRYYADAQTQGNVYPPFLSLAAYRNQPRSSLIYSSWHLWGTTAARAKDLVTRAMAVESAGGLAGTGTAYLDRQTPDSYQLSGTDYAGGAGDQDLARTAALLASAGFPVVNDGNYEEFGTSPAPLTVAAPAPDAAIYCGWYSYNNYNDVFVWRPGAIGWHLDSGSAYELNTSTQSWSAGALNRGITVTAGAIWEPYLEGLPHSDVVFRHLLQGGLVGDAFLRGTAWLKWMIIFIGDPLYRPFPAGLPTNFSNEPSLRITPQFVVGGKSSTATLTLAQVAPAGGKIVPILTDRPAYLTGLPASVTVPAGQMAASFSFGTVPVGIGGYPAILANLEGTTYIRNTLGVLPLLAAVDTASQSITGPSANNTGVVYLNSASAFGGTTVSLSASPAGVLNLPATVTVPFGASVALFSFSANAVVGSPTVTITATNAGASVTKVVTVHP